MVEAVLEYLHRQMDENILQMLSGCEDALSKLQRMCLSLLELYEGGNQPCMFAILLMGSARDVFHQKVKVLFCDWIDAIALVLIESGIDEKLAHQRAEDAATFIQGSLILSQALCDSSVFQRAIKRLPKQILQR